MSRWGKSVIPWLILATILILPSPVAAQGVGVFSRPDCTTITSAVTGKTECLDTTRGVWNNYDGTGWQSDAALAQNRVILTDPRWGAHADGVLDDTTAVRNACDYAATINAPLFLGSKRYAISNVTFSPGCSLIGDGPSDQGYAGFVFTGTGTVFTFGAPQGGWVFKGFKIYLDNIGTNLGANLGMSFPQGLANARFDDMGCKAYFVGGVYANQDCINISGGYGGIKVDVSELTFIHLFLERVRYGVTFTDPFAGAAGGESVFITPVGTCQVYCFRTTGRHNVWIGGDPASVVAGGTVWSFYGVYASGNVLQGVGPELIQAGDFAITIDATNNAVSTVATIIGGKVYTGSWYVDNGLPVGKLSRVTRIGDEDALNSVVAQSVGVSSQPGLTTTVANFGGIVGDSAATHTLLQLRGSFDAVTGMILIGNPNSTGVNEPAASSVTLVSGGGAIRFATTADGTTLTTRYAFAADGTVTLTVPLGVPSGGSGAGTFTQHGLLLGNGTGVFGVTAVCGTGTYLRGATGADPICSTLLLPNAATQGALVVGTAANTWGEVLDVAIGQVLTSGGLSTVPAWSATPTLTSMTFGSGTALSSYVEATWTPADVSGASLAFVNVSGQYTRIGRMIFATASWAYPATADGSGAAFSLPVTTANAQYGRSPCTVVSNGAAGATAALPNANSTTATFYTDVAGGVTNANMSTLTTFVSCVYPAL